jgi:hypothetical protein
MTTWRQTLKTTNCKQMRHPNDPSSRCGRVIVWDASAIGEAVQHVASLDDLKQLSTEIAHAYIHELRHKKGVARYPAMRQEREAILRSEKEHISALIDITRRSFDQSIVENWHETQADLHTRIDLADAKVADAMTLAAKAVRQSIATRLELKARSIEYARAATHITGRRPSEYRPATPNGKIMQFGDAQDGENILLGWFGSRAADLVGRGVTPTLEEFRRGRM